MPAISFTTSAPDLPYLDLEDAPFEPNMFAADTVHAVHPLCTIKNDLTIQGPNQDAPTTRTQHAAYTRRSVGHGGCTDQPFDLAAADAAPLSSPFWGVSFEDGGNEDDMFPANLYTSFGANLPETRQCEAGDDACDSCHPLWELAGVTATTDDHPVWGIVPDVEPVSLCSCPIDVAMGFDDDLRTSTIHEVDWDKYWNEFELSRPVPTTSSPLQDMDGQRTQRVVVDLTESDTDDEPRAYAQKVQTRSERRRYFKSPSRNTADPDANPRATIKSVQLRLGSEVQRFSWRRRDGVWRNQYNGTLNLLGLANPYMTFSICLELFVCDDGATVPLVWDQEQQLFVGSDLVAGRTFSICAEEAWSRLCNPDISQPVRWVPAS